jgi:hypothetical protein
VRQSDRAKRGEVDLLNRAEITATTFCISGRAASINTCRRLRARRHLFLEGRTMAKRTILICETCDKKIKAADRALHDGHTITENTGSSPIPPVKARGVADPRLSLRGRDQQTAQMPGPS